MHVVRLHIKQYCHSNDVKFTKYCLTGIIGNSRLLCTEARSIQCVNRWGNAKYSVNNAAQTHISLNNWTNYEVISYQLWHHKAIAMFTPITDFRTLFLTTAVHPKNVTYSYLHHNNYKQLIYQSLSCNRKQTNN